MEKKTLFNTLKGIKGNMKRTCHYESNAIIHIFANGKPTLVGTIESTIDALNLKHYSDMVDLIKPVRNGLVDEIVEHSGCPKLNLPQQVYIYITKEDNQND